MDPETSHGAPDGPSPSGVRVTIFSRAFPPAFLGGGPARSVDGLVGRLGSQFDLSVVASAFDVSSSPMPGIRPDEWLTYGPAKVLYRSSGTAIRGTRRALSSSSPELVYLNSLFDISFSLIPLLLTIFKRPRTPVLLAPRGELSKGALVTRPLRKRLFLSAYRLLRLHRRVQWHASTERERSDIERALGSVLTIHVAPNLRAEEDAPSIGTLDHQRAGIVFLSRIVPKKNLATLLQALHVLDRPISLTIGGPLEDPEYWQECLRILEPVKATHDIKAVGPVPPEEVLSFLAGFELFVFPTLGENFGHVIYEALCSGTPVITGRDTPWQELEARNAGWMCDESSPEDIARCIKRFFDLSPGDQRKMRDAAQRYGQDVITDPHAMELNTKMFFAALDSSR